MFILGISLTLNGVFVFMHIYGNYIKKKQQKTLKEYLNMNYEIRNNWMMYDS